VSAALTPRTASEARALWSLALLAFPLSAVLSVGFGLGLMGWVGCRYLSPTLGGLGASGAVILVGALAASLMLNVSKARRAIGLASQVASDIDDPVRLADVARLARAIGIAPPVLRVVPVNVPVAFAIQGSTPAIVFSTWVLERLDSPEWQAVVAHELAHLRPQDRFVRWMGCWLLGASRLVPGAQHAWRRLEAATEDVADEVALKTVGDSSALASARAKFGASSAQGTRISDLARSLTPVSRSHQFAAACLGVVLSLPFVPFVLVPLCAIACAR
jgi:hypothetical protein